ncbi:glycosyl hydrolase family 18 protein [Streptomyces sp. NPDC059063]|uniref:glycosyl hydrolase family 18 protein n=1 Tax=unclassified Streptomyces TaxID=2593676 RepID=UPI00368DBC49
MRVRRTAAGLCTALALALLATPAVADDGPRRSTKSQAPGKPDGPDGPKRPDRPDKPRRPAAAKATGGAAAAPATTATETMADGDEGPPTDGKFYVQNVLSGYHMSASKEWVATHRPKGDEDAAQWEFSRNANGTYKIKNPDVDGKCLTEKNNPEGDARLVMGACDAEKTDWEFRLDKGEKYQIFVPGTNRRLWGEPVMDSPMQVKITEKDLTNDSWYVTPINPPKSPMPADPTLDDMTFLTTHNAFYNQEDASGGAPVPNQSHSIKKQLNNGVRGLMLDAGYMNGRVRMCHGGVCLPTGQTMSTVFTDIADFLKANPKDIVTVMLEDYTEPEDLRDEVGDDLGPGGQLDGLVFRPDSERWNVKEKGWPKVSEMVRADNRLLLFTGKTDKKDLGFMFYKDWTVENYWSMGGATGNSDWSCYSRWDDYPMSGEEKNFRRLFTMNHFRDSAIGVTPGNDNSKVQNRAERFCAPAARKKPNFVAVDMYQDGDPMSAVKDMNTYTYHGDTPGMGGTPETPPSTGGAGDPVDNAADDRSAKPSTSGPHERCRPEGLAATKGVDTPYCKVYGDDGREWLGGNGHDKRVVGYFTGWRTGAKGDPRYLVKNIPWSKVSHVNYAFAKVDDGNRISVGDTSDPANPATGMTWPGVRGAEMDDSLPYKGHFNLLTRYKKKHPQVKTLISVGGWAETKNFYTMATNADGSVNQAGIDTFADSAAAFLDRYGFDGVDIDYEYPTALPNSGNPADWQLSNGRRKGLQAGYNALMKTLRAKLDRAGADQGRYYLLTSAGSASGYLVRGYDAGQALQYQDFVNVMSYDLHGSWNKYVGPQAPLYDDGKDAELAAANVYGEKEFDRTGYFNVDWAYHYYRGALAPGRINLGVPYYTRGWQNVTGGSDGLWGTSQLPDQGQCQPGTGTGNGAKTECGHGAEGIDNVWHDLGTRGEEVASGSNPLWHAKNLQAGVTPGYLSSYVDTGKESGRLKGTYAEKYDGTLKASWLWNAEKKVFLSTENDASIDAKAQYVKDQGIGGVMLWELAGDYTKRGNGEYGMGYDVTSRLDDALHGSGGYRTSRAGDTELPDDVVDVTAEFVDYPTAEGDLWPIQPKLRISNNSGRTLGPGTEIAFDLPTTTSPLLKDEGWTELKDAVKPGRSGPNVGGLKADFHRVTLKLGYCESVPAGKSHDIGLKYWLPVTGPANVTVSTGGHTYGSVQDGRKGTTTVEPDTGGAKDCGAPEWKKGTAHGKTVGRVWAAWDKGDKGWQFEYQGGLMDHHRGESRAHLIEPINGENNQLWSPKPAGGGWYTIGNAGKCLTAAGAREDIRTAACGASDAQKWHFVSVDPATGAEGGPAAPAHGKLFTLRSATGKDVEAEFGATAPGTHLWGGNTADPATGAYVAWKGHYWAASWYTTVEPGTPERDSQGKEVFPWRRLGPTP